MGPIGVPESAWRTGLEFRILGPLEVTDHGRLLPLAGGRQRTLLAALLLQANQVVSNDRLIDALWGTEPPATARTALQVHVSQLRKLLGPDRILTRPAGYLLQVRAEEFDLALAEELVGDGGADRGQRLRRALALWRGPALVDFGHEPFAQADIARLEELHLAAVEERIEDDLALGRHRELIGELEALVRQHPFRERPRAQLMLALYRCGRQAEALALGRKTRRLFVEDLGIEPGPELRQLERRILNHDQALAPRPNQPTAPARPAVVDARPAREERKVLSVLIADVVRGASPAEQLDPEDVRAAVSPYQRRLRAVLERYGGTVEMYMGDAAMALFGAPVTHEDDAERAVRAALAINDWIAGQDQSLRLRITVSTGEALVRLGARLADGAGVAVGEVVNAAARLQRAAPAGAVVVDQATYVATRRWISYDPLQTVAPPGAAPVALWLARDARSRSAVESARPAGTPFVGRDADVALLEQAWSRTLRTSSVQLVTVVGEPGIGKTRLVAEFRRSSRERPGTVAWRYGRCPSYGEGVTFWALGEVVKAEAGILESDPPEAASAKLAAAVEAAIGQEPERAWVARRLEPLVGTIRDGATVTERSERRSEAFSAWRAFLEAIAAREPLVVVLEDLHWADPSLLEFVEELVDRSADVPLLVVCTARPELHERAPGWGGGKRNSITISLSPLSDEETTRLVNALLRGAGLPARIRAGLLRRAGGNPLYAEEFVRMLGDRGLLRGRNGGVDLPAGGEVPVPGNLRAVIAARLDTLPPDRKALLHDAAVVGKVFWAGALAAMGGLPEQEVLEGLHGLARRELVRRVRASSIAADVEYTFWHALVRDVAYAQIPRAARARKHVAAAEWIEGITARRVSDQAELLAHHYTTGLELTQAAVGADEAAALRERAIRFLTLAGGRALSLNHAQGERYFRLALGLLPDDDPRRPVMLARAADAAILGAAVSFDEIKRMLREAIAALRAQGHATAAADAMRHLSYAMLKHGDSAKERYQLAAEACRLLEQVPAGPELALCYARIAHECMFAERGFQETLGWMGKALPLLDRFGLDDEALHMRSLRATLRCERGDLGGLDEHRELLRDALDPARGYGTTAAFIAYNNLQTDVHRFGEGPAAALDLLRAQGQLAQRRGLVLFEQWTLGSAAELLYELGDWDEVLRAADEVAEWERERGRGVNGLLAPPYAAKVLAARGATEAAAAVVADLLPRARVSQDLPAVLPALTAAALVDLARGELSPAVRLVAEVEELTRGRDDYHRVAAIPELGRVCAAAGELSLLERFLTGRPPVGPRWASVVLSGHAILAEARAEHSVAASMYERAEQGWQAHGSVVEQAHALLGLSRSRLALGRRGEAVASLGEARRQFARLRARTLLDEVDGLLMAAAPPHSTNLDAGVIARDSI